MSLLSKIFSNETISRRDSLEAICNFGKITFIATTFPSFLRAQYYLDFKLTPFILQNPLVKYEIINFLDQKEVIDALGFDPLNYDKLIILEITETNEDLGSQDGDCASISAYLFSDSDLYISTQILKEKYHQRLAELRNDPEMLKLYRGLAVVHEIAHIAEEYSNQKPSLFTKASPIILTGHGVTYRIEVEVIENLYNSGKVDLEMCEKMFNFFEKYMNNRPTQPKTTIDRYFQEHFHNQNNK